MVKEHGTVLETRVWDEKKLKGTEILEKLNQEFYRKFNYGNIYSIHLKTLIKEFSENNRLTQLTEDLIFVEQQIRNLAAHEIVSITEDTIIKRTGFTAQQIMNRIKEIFTYTGIRVKNSDWDAYNAMNKEIISRIKSPS